MHTRASTWTALLVAASTLLTSSLAEANGRFPESNQLIFSPVDPDLVLMRVTFGLLVSHDRGKTFDWVCEQSVGFSGVEDPMYAIMGSGTYVGTTFQGVTISRDKACGWSFAGGDLTQQVFIDLSLNPKDNGDVVVFASSYEKQDEQGNVLFTSKIWESKDDAKSFQLLGDRLDPALLGYTVDLTASDPNRIYVTAVRNPGLTPIGSLLVSKDHGKTWSEEVVPFENGERAVFVAAVDPNDAERVYLRTSNNPDKPTRLIVREATDGGAGTLRTVKAAQGALLGFALSADGSKVYVGGPKDGVQVASTSDFAFAQRSNAQVQCMTLTDEGLWICSNEVQGFIAGLSKDDGVTFEPRLHFCDGNADAPGIRGPLACAAGTPTADHCNAVWPQQKALLGCGGENSDAGPRADASADGGGSTSEAPTSGSNCDCHTTTQTSGWGALLAAAGATTLALRRARRKRTQGRAC